MTFTNLTYTEFDSTVQNLPRDLGQALVGSAAWSKVSPTGVLCQTNALQATNSSTLPFAAGVPAAAGIVVGTIVRIGDYGAADLEWRQVTAVASTTISLTTNTSFAHASGTNIYVGNEVFKATTTRGADMILDLCFNQYLVTGANGLSMAVYRSYSGTGLGTPTDISARWLWWKGTANTAATVVHCIVSASKDHLFISTEGPRQNETNPDSASLGSVRDYMFIDDIVPYYTTPYDTVAAVYAGGLMQNSYLASTTLSFYGHQSRNPLNTSSWEQSKLASLAHPDSGALALSMNLQRNAPDGSYTVFPYVVFGDLTGMRGRLGHFWFAGFMAPDFSDSWVSPPPTGSKIVKDGDTYKLLSVNRSGINNDSWQQFGGSVNQSGSARGPIVAVPST